MLGIRVTRRRVVAGILVVTAAVAAFVGVRGVPLQTAPSQAGAASLPIGPAEASSEPATEAFAQVRGLALYVPARRYIALAYHEASRHNALALTPLGTCVRNENRTKFTRPQPTAGPRYMVMSSRGRPDPATSALDVAMRPGEPVLSPVSGIVLRVKRYRLYHTYPDIRVVVQPAGRPDLQIVLIHLTDREVSRGSVLFAGVSVIAYPRPLPFRSQVNDYVGAGISHVHLEVKTVGA
jgi:hypothetical protein